MAASGLSGGEQLGNMAFNAAGMGMDAYMGRGSQLADIYGSRGLAQSRLTQDATNNITQMGINQGLTNANYLYDAGNTLGQNRFTAGRDIARNNADSVLNLAGLATDQGTGMADMYGSQADILAGLQTGYGANTANVVGGMGNNLAGIATGTGASYNPAATGRTTENKGIIGNTFGGTGASAGAASLLKSDVRLKENIVKKGQTDSGINLYTWDWTDEAKGLVGDQPGYGVIAQELLSIRPDAVLLGDDGYLRVDYSKVS